MSKYTFKQVLVHISAVRESANDCFQFWWLNQLLNNPKLFFDSWMSTDNSEYLSYKPHCVQTQTHYKTPQLFGNPIQDVISQQHYNSIQCSNLQSKVLVFPFFALLSIKNSTRVCLASNITLRTIDRIIRIPYTAQERTLFHNDGHHSFITQRDLLIYPPQAPRWKTFTLQPHSLGISTIWYDMP